MPRMISKDSGGALSEKLPLRPIVSIVKCDDYEKKRVYDAVKEALKPLGGMGAFVKPGERVLLKPNLLCDTPPEKNVTTHPSVVEAVIRLVKEAGAVPVVGDSPGLASFQKAARAAGIEDAAKNAGAEMAVFKSSVPVGAAGYTFKDIELAKEVFDCDRVINLPKLKTHVQMVLTLGIKNLFGCVVGKRKSQWHLMAGKDTRYFAGMIVDIFKAVRPDLTIMDGVVAMHGDGPQNGQAYPMGLIYAANDTVALDSAITYQVGLTRDKNPILSVAVENGLGEADIGKIDFPGLHPSNVLKKDFSIPGLMELEIGPSFLRPRLRRMLVPKPVTDHSKCTLCNRCKEVCPPRIINTVNKKITINYDSCIHCFCCVEICPEGAMTVHRSLLSKIISGMQ